MSAPQKGRLIVLEGTDGSGKSTQFQALCARVEQTGTPFRRLVFPQGAEEILKPLPGEHRLRVVFHGAPTTRTPLIAQMAMERQIAANILSASTQSIGDRVYGNMLLSIAGGAGQAREAAAYLQNIPDILVEEVPSHV